MSTIKPYGEKLVTNSGMGGFLCPPGHPTHTMSVQTGRSDNPKSIQSIESASKCEWHSPAMRGRCAGILKRWQQEKLPLSDPKVKAWVWEVLGYFANCYAGQNSKGEQSWNCGDLRIDFNADPLASADLHAGVHCIREYYPEFAPTPEDFKQAQWGCKGNEVAK